AGRCAPAVTALGKDVAHVRTADPILLVVLLQWFDPHRPHSLFDHFADWVIHHRRRYSGLQAKAVRQIGSDVVFAAADMNLTFDRFAKGNDAWIEAMDHRAQR